jgi:hypothetical protein
MTPLFGPKIPPPGVAFGPGYGEHQAGGWRAPFDPAWSGPRWQTKPWSGGWAHAPLDPYGQFQPGQGWFGGWRS